ncbi:FxLYD domain-containing protein [Halovivax cerinus]|uniref:FxLYD domain-containing protein n=1 Tax=Halovivax cerinus TaxID=1487865 RepID=A0ABD5NR33_9EURY|nr:FxLYD domain-containing protein [Halovivax cerinus]
MRRRHTLVAGGVALTGLLSGCSEDGEYPSETNDTPTATVSGSTPDSGQFAFPEHRFVNNSGYGEAFVTGQVTTEDTATDGKVLVRVTFRNESGAKLTTETDGVGAIDAGEVKIFKIYVPQDMKGDAVAAYNLSTTPLE